MPQQKYPVYIYIHGGAYHSGSGNVGHQGIFENFNSAGIIFVTMNYRLNIFGWLLSLWEPDILSSVCRANFCA